MIVGIECRDLTSAFKALMLQRGVTYRDMSIKLGINHTTIWRAITKPRSASAIVLFKIVKELGLSWEKFDELFDDCPK